MITGKFGNFTFSAGCSQLFVSVVCDDVAMHD